MGTFQGRQALVFAAGPETEYSYIHTYLENHPKCVIACADGGLRHAQALGLNPDLIIGDFDSINEAETKAEIIRLQPEKDDTDTQHCVRELIARGCAEITVVCATGGRLDHLLANLSLCEQAAELGGHCVILDQQNLVFLHVGGRQRFKTDLQYKFFSIIPLDQALKGVTIEHAKYPLKDVTVLRPGMISISNEALGDHFIINIARGRALIVLSRDR